MLILMLYWKSRYYIMIYCMGKLLKRLIILIMITIILSTSTTAFASGTFKSYNYNSYSESFETPSGYLRDKTLSGVDLGIGDLTKPTDIFALHDELYIIDGATGKIFILSKELTLIKTLDNFIYNGKEEKLKDPTGIFVDENKNIYIADKSNSRIIITDSQGQISRIIGRPRADIIDKDFNFLPIKISVDKRGTIYVLSENCFQGLLLFDKTGKFNGFFGSNRVEVTPQIIAQKFQRRFMSQEQLDAVVQYTPIEYSNFSIDADGFVYACVKNTTSSKDEIKKINAKGVNVLSTINNSVTQNDYGDLEWNIYKGKKVDTNFIDIAVDDKGFISVLDFTRGRIFQYDQESNLLFVLGNLGNQSGTFVMPVAIEYFNGQLLVLDSQKANLTFLSPTPFGNSVRDAIILYNDGRFKEAVPLFDKVLRMCSNYELAYKGKGKSALMQNDYKSALKYFEISNYKKGYSDALKEYRLVVIGENFPLVVLIIFLLCMLMLASVNNQKVKAFYYKIRKRPYDVENDIKKEHYPFRVLFHPFEGFAIMKYKKAYSMKWANIILVLFFFVTVFEKLEKGFHFNETRIENFNIISNFGLTIGIFLIFVVANWGMSTLADGEGKLNEIYMVCSYSLMPYVILTVPLTLLSKVITIEEGSFLSIASTIVVLWCVLLFIMAVKDTHNYTFGKAVGIIIFSLIGILVIMFLLVLIFSMFQQFGIFIKTIFDELAFRM